MSARPPHPISPVSPDEAWRRIAAHTAPLPEERVERRQAAGRVLTRPLLATVDAPAVDVSAMDGYAFGGELAPGASRPVVATVTAGDPPGLELPAGAAARIMTGAPLPRGADRVLPVEAAELVEAAGLAPIAEIAAAAGLGALGGLAAAAGAGEQGARGVRLRSGEPAPPAGQHIRRRGEVTREGDLLLPAGALLTPGALSLAASHGHAELPVHRAPTLAILTTGDEVVPPETVPGPGQLRDSHTDFLLAAAGTLGLRPLPLGIAPDRPAELRALVERGLQADVLLLCGGVSMGELDFVEGVLGELGCSTHFDAVAIQPGQPLVFATHPGGWVFGLPGNPASVMVGFWLFVRPALRRLLGSADAWWQGALAATLAAPLPAAGKRDRFIAAEAAAEAGRLRVTPRLAKGSHDLAAYGGGTALVRVPAGSAAAPAGSPCEILPLPDWRL
jgi:molybdopterin molybdotransferase